MAFLLTRLMVEIFIIARAGVKVQTAVWPWAPPLTIPPHSLPSPGMRDEQGMSSDEVLENSISVGAAQAPAQELSLAAQRLLGQFGHVSHWRRKRKRGRECE